MTTPPIYGQPDPDPVDPPVAVYGLGRMGLPLAAVIADRVGNVVGVDIDSSVVRAVNDGDSPIPNEPGLDELVARTVRTGALRATTDASAAAHHARAHVVIVPTTVSDHEPSLDALEAAVESIGAGLAAGDAVFVECTVPPGTCRDLVTPRLEDVSGLDRSSFGVAFCPERTSSGRAIRDIRGAYPKVVGGTDGAATAAARRFYRRVTDAEIHAVADATTAEAVKLFEGMYRDVNIALANELGRVAESLGIDGRETIAVANGQPYCEIHDPGPGVGGHCIPYYPWFLMDATERPTPLLRTARAVNESMPTHTVERLTDLVAAEATVLLLGVSYRPGVAGTDHSPAIPIARELAERGRHVMACDPHVSAADRPELPARWVSLDEASDVTADAVCVVTPHEAFESLDWAAFEDTPVLDARDGVDGLETAVTIGDGRS